MNETWPHPGQKKNCNRRDVVRLHPPDLERDGRRAVVPGLLRRRMLDLPALLAQGFAEALFTAGEGGIKEAGN